MSTDPVRPKGSPSPPPAALPDKSEKTGKAAAHTPHKPYEKARAKPDLPKPTVRAGRFGKHPPPLTVTRTVIGEQHIPLPGELPPTRTEQHIWMPTGPFNISPPIKYSESDSKAFKAAFGIGPKHAHPTTPIATKSSEAGLMDSAMDRLDRALGAYEQQVKELEAPGAFADDIRRPLSLAAREVQGQLNSGNAHADGWFKDRPNEMKDAKGALQERSARFEALTQRANAADSTLHIRLPLHVPDRH